MGFKEVHIFPKGIRPKVNIIARLESKSRTLMSQFSTLATAARKLLLVQEKLVNYKDETWLRDKRKILFSFIVVGNVVRLFIQGCHIPELYFRRTMWNIHVSAPGLFTPTLMVGWSVRSLMIAWFPSDPLIKSTFFYYLRLKFLRVM